MGPLALVGGGLQVVGGLINYFDGKKRSKELEGKLKDAEASLNASKEAFKNLDTSNPYLNMTNVYEDMTVNQREAEFMKQQQFQNQANILQSLRGAAGSSGIAALAQSLANQGALDAQKAAVSIGAQEKTNQEKQLAEESKIQSMEREGEVLSRQAEASKLGALMQLDAQQLALTQNALSTARGDMAAGMSGAGAGMLSFFNN